MSPEADPLFDVGNEDVVDADITGAIHRVIQTMGGEPEAGREYGAVGISVVDSAPAQADPAPYVEKVLHRILQLPFDTCVRLAARWDLKPRSPEEIEHMIHESEIGELYPGLAVPPAFCDERPSVLFLPPDLRRYRHPADPSSQAVNRFIKESGLDTTPLLNAQQVAQLIHSLQGNFPEDVTPDDRQRVLCQIVQSFIGSLELHRITKDQDGAVVRFSDTPAEDLDRTTYNFDNRLLGYIGMLHETLYSQFRSHWITWWHRTNIDPTDPSSQSKMRRPAITSSLRELEADHLISLDLICEGAVVAIRKQPPTS